MSTCPICHDDICNDQDIIYTCCGHCFHDICLDRWLIRANTCPMCRFALAQPVNIIHVMVPIPNQPSQMLRMELSYRNADTPRVIHQEQVQVS